MTPQALRAVMCGGEALAPQIVNGSKAASEPSCTTCTDRLKTIIDSTYWPVRRVRCPFCNSYRTSYTERTSIYLG